VSLRPEGGGVTLVYHLRDQDPPGADITDPLGPRVLLVDPHLGIRAAVAELLAEHDIQVVGTAPDGDTALELARAHQPTVVLLEVRLGGSTGRDRGAVPEGGRAEGRSAGSGLALVRALKDAAPRVQVLIFTVLDSLALAEAATRAGAFALVTKGSSSAALIRVIREAHAACGR
jgi:DNA-binding NarL/FixJ family response regulator